MRLRKHTIVVCIVALLLATVPAAFAAGQPGQITAQQDWTQTVDDNDIAVSFVVNTSGNQSLAHTTVNVTHVPDELQLSANRSQRVERVPGDGEAVVTYDIHIPAEVPVGNYSVTAELTRENRTIDSANYTVWVNYGNQQSDSSQSGSQQDNSADKPEPASGGMMVVERNCGWTCFDDNLMSTVDGWELLPDWDFPFL